MFAGDADGRVPGMTPEAPLRVIDPFVRDGGDERSDAFGLVAAIDDLLADEVRVINLSLAGPENPLLADAMARSEGADVVVVAAAGNEGPRADPLYPAGYDTVLAVTAVDRRSRIWRRAGQGPHVDLAAPGVSIPTAASISGIRPQTGTSFAAPFVTVAAAAELSRRVDATPAEVRAALVGASIDLGEPGRDDVFGWGMVQVGSACPQTAGEPAA